MRVFDYLFNFNRFIEEINILFRFSVTINLNRYKTRKTDPKKTSVTLTDKQKDVIVGTRLGDASMERNKPNHNTRVRFDQTFSAHASYLIHLYIIFKNLVNTVPKVHV